MKTLAFLHTTAVTVPVMKELAVRELEGIRAIQLLDDSLLVDVISAGAVTAAVETRLRAYAEQAHVAGADALLCCCSSIGEAMEQIAKVAPLPVWRIDEAMAEEAAAAAGEQGNIGVLATLPTTLRPTVRLIERAIVARGRPITVEPLLVERAFAELSAGNAEEHDARIRAALVGIFPRAAVVVLAQASMARVIASLAEASGVPILTSTLSGIRRARSRLRDV